MSNNYTLKLANIVTCGELDSLDVLLNILENMQSGFIEDFIEEEYGSFIDESPSSEKEICDNCYSSITWFTHECSGLGKEIRGCTTCDNTCHHCSS